LALNKFLLYHNVDADPDPKRVNLGTSFDSDASGALNF
jgi:hypothetical protein